ncbi:hypothetical protein Zmor_015324 [Zophobas morio]|uniref:Peptidase S1 domain-containing protein n=1 Tax=Zophobas morio TaxID=2755281 RepID=A0AA38ILB1_9CUCU|nr:hypothetical protein Zmor_015324 [Zophobas morio]
MYRYIITTLLIFGVPSLQHKIPRNERIIGGNPARAGQFPFAVAIFVQTSDSRFFCGGSLLTTRHILTAAHCVDGGIVFNVQAGSNRLEGDEAYRYDASTNDYILHPDYNPETLENNVGFVVLRMDMPLIVGYRWSVSYLPTEDLEAGEGAIAIGWGQLGDETPGPENDLHYVDLATLTNAECKLTYGNQITDDMVCAEGNYNEGTCIGDSGSPLVQNVRLGLMKQVGIATFVSTNGCESTDPSGFTRLYPHIDWIKNITNRD